MTKVTVYGSLNDNGDGSVSITWYLKEESAKYDQENAYQPFGEECIEEVETYEGANIHMTAIENEAELLKDRNDDDFDDDFADDWDDDEDDDDCFSFSITDDDDEDDDDDDDDDEDWDDDDWDDDDWEDD